MKPILILLTLVSVLSISGCQQEVYPVAGKTGQLPPADSPIGKRVREGMARRGRGPTSPGGQTSQTGAH